MLNVKVYLKYYPYLGLMSTLTLRVDGPINSNISHFLFTVGLFHLVSKQD